MLGLSHSAVWEGILQGGGLSFYFTQKRGLEVISTMLVCYRRVSEIEEHQVGQEEDVLCSGRADTRGHCPEVMPPPCVLLWRNKRQIETRKGA